WNSPNQWGWWSIRGLHGGPNPAQYANVWSWAADQIHQVAHAHRVHIPVLFGAVGLGNRSNRRDMDMGSFLHGFYQYVNRSVLRRRDGLSVHAYPSKDDLATNMHSRFLRSIQIARAERNRLDPRGAGRRLWITEIGLSTTWPRASERFTTGQQAQGLV